MAAILHLPYREPGLFNPENCWNNSGSFEFDATVITKPVLTCLASNPIWGNMWIPYLDRVRMSRLKVVRDLGMMEMGCLRWFWKSVIQFFSVLLGIGISGIRWHPVCKPTWGTEIQFLLKNGTATESGSGRPKVGTGFVVGVQFPPRALLLVVLLVGFLEFGHSVILSWCVVEQLLTWAVLYKQQHCWYFRGIKYNSDSSAQQTH